MGEYSILSRAGDSPEAQGALVGWHLDHLANAEARLATEVASIDAQRALLQARIDVLDESEKLATERFAHDTRWDLWMLRDYYQNAPQFAGAKRKSADFGGYVIGSKTQVVAKPKILVCDEAYMKTAFPDLVETTLRMGDMMKELRITKDGHVAFADTGELLPETAVRVEPGSTAEVYYVEGPAGKYTVGSEPPEWAFGIDETDEEGNDSGSNGSDDEQES
jgi:hypothetical protein